MMLELEDRCVVDKRWEDQDLGLNLVAMRARRFGWSLCKPRRVRRAGHLAMSVAMRARERRDPAWA